MAENKYPSKLTMRKTPAATERHRPPCATLCMGCATKDLLPGLKTRTHDPTLVSRLLPDKLPQGRRNALRIAQEAGECPNELRACGNGHARHEQTKV